eukprot:5134097-Amphidinium_carterae.3
MLFYLIPVVQPMCFPLEHFQSNQAAVRCQGVGDSNACPGKRGHVSYVVLQSLQRPRSTGSVAIICSLVATAC